jgi:PhoH-like ATPase
VTRTSSPRSRRTYVLDTSVLLADPQALVRFDEHEVVLPLVVLSELEAKRHDPVLGWAARQALRALEDLRAAHGSLALDLVVNEQGGTARVELNHVGSSALPPAFAMDVNDNRILAVAANLAVERPGGTVVVVSKDLPLRLKASVVGLDAEEYRNELVDDDGWTGMAELAVAPAVIDELHASGAADIDEARQLLVNTCLVMASGSQSALGRVHEDKRVRLVRGDSNLFDVKGRSAEQRLALDLLADPSVGIVSLGGPAGTGKTVLALAAGLEAVVNRQTHKRVIVFRNIYPVGGQDLGYLPGDVSEKMTPHSAAVFDALEAFAGEMVIDEVMDRGQLEILPLTHIRGRTLADAIVVLDEAQNLERATLLTALSRLGRNSRVFLTHDVAQRDNLRVGRYDGVAAVIERLKGHPLFGHMTLSRAERSPIAALVTELLDG